jgi:predicted nucleotidyltransferase
MDIGSLSEDLCRWAASKPLVNRLWIFGSRARGDYRPDSDLDVAIELDLSAASGVDESGGLATWMLDTTGWRDELQQLTGLAVDLQHFDGPRTPTIQSGLQQSSLLVYAKAAA